MSTIFAPITAIANSSIAVIRISGLKSLWCLKMLGIASPPKANETKFAKILDPNNADVIDEVMVSYFAAPKSFTGQDVVEIAFHGSNYIAKKILSSLSSFKDVRLAQPGEFSKIAFFNNKFDLVQAEAIVDLIKSETKTQHDQAIKQLSGEVSDLYDNWRQKIIQISALIESAIDFADEDLPEEIIDQAQEKVSNLKQEISSHLNDGKRGQKIKDGLSLAIIGAPNVGKSSLLNFLAKSDAAIVSDIEGTTRDVIEINLDIAGMSVKIADTAGIRKSDDKIEQQGIKRAYEKAKNADLKIFMFDIEQKLNYEELFQDESVIRILNKTDLIDRGVKTMPYDVAISLTHKQNLDLLMKKLESEVLKIAPKNNEILITQERYRIALLKTMESLEAFNLDENIEIAAENLRIASCEIAKITGKINVDDILDVIFSQFCIGK